MDSLEDAKVTVDSGDSGDQRKAAESAVRPDLTTITPKLEESISTGSGIESHRPEFEKKMDSLVDTKVTVDSGDQPKAAAESVISPEPVPPAPEPKESISTDVLTTATGIEYSFGTFFNWFMPSCMDIWTTEDNSYTTTTTGPSETIIAYGARSYLFLLDVRHLPTEGKGRLLVGDEANYSIGYRDLINVFNHTISKKFTDVFRTTNTYVTTVVFEKQRDFIGRQRGASAEEGAQGPRVFVGNSDGNVALYDLHKRFTVLQDLPFASYKRPCCRKVSASKILSAAWITFKSLGSVVFYSLDTHLIRWHVATNEVSVQHDGEAECGLGGRLLGQLQISCLASMSAEVTCDKAEHKLAIGFNGGKIALFGFDPITGAQKSLTLLTDNSHNDDICSLSFTSYSIASITSYRSGLFTSVSRDSVLKVWSCSTTSEIAEFRINGQFNRPEDRQGGSSSSQQQQGGGPSEGQSKCNWFAASFLPRPSILQPQTGQVAASTKSSASYEILVTAPTGELITITLPEKEPNSKLRIAKANKFSSNRGGGTGLRGQPAGQAHQSVIFSIMISPRLAIAITYSLDYKMLLWDLSTRSSKAVFQLFSNGCLSIDSCLKDKRLALAFGNAVYTMDFGGQSASIITTRCTTAPKNWKFYQVSWNNLSDSERLGALAMGNSNGEVLYYDLNERSYLMKPGKKVYGKGGGGGDLSKIYKFVWPVKFPGSSSSATGHDQPRTVVLSLHASGIILVNYIPSRFHPNRQPENFMTAKFVSGLPAEGVLRKHSALDEYDRGRYLVIGNDDGTVDVLKHDEQKSKVVTGSTQLYRHLFRFRAFTKPIISIEVTGNGAEAGLWLAITAMHDNFAHCYLLDGELVEEILPGSTTEIVQEEPKPPPGEVIIRQPAKRFILTGHTDRVAASAWSPFLDDPEARLLVTVSYDTTCIIWNVLQQQPLKRFYGHRSLIYVVRWSHFRADLIFTGGEDCFHAWNWTVQPDFEPKTAAALGRSHVKVESLKKSCTKDDYSTDKEPEVVKVKSQSAPSTASSTTVSVTTTSLTVKALFSVSNQIENNSSKYNILEDIKWIVRLRQYCQSNPQSSAPIPAEVIPATKLNSILLYGSRPEEARAFLELEKENHLKSRQMDSAEMVAMMADFRLAIEKAVEDGEADLVLASYAVALSRELYKKCVDCYWKNATGSSAGKGNALTLSRTQRLLVAYSKEMHALGQLYCLADFHGAIQGLVDAGLYRGAIILARVNLASEPFLRELWDKWYKARLSQGSYEGAIKCLVASGRIEEALQLLVQRRMLCADTSGSNVLKQYDEVIEFLKEL